MIFINIKSVQISNHERKETYEKNSANFLKNLAMQGWRQFLINPVGKMLETEIVLLSF